MLEEKSVVAIKDGDWWKSERAIFPPVGAEIFKRGEGYKTVTFNTCCISKN